MPNITVSPVVDNFLRQQSPDNAAAAIRATPLDNRNRVPTQYIHGDSYVSLIKVSENLNNVSGLTQPVAGNFFATYDDVSFATCYNVGVRNTLFECAISTIADTEIAPSDTLPNLTTLGLFTQNPVTVKSTFRDRLPNIVNFVADFSTFTMEGNFPPRVSNITLIGSVNNATSLDNILITLNNSVTGGGAFFSGGWAVSPTSASLSARQSLTQKGWTLIFN